MAGYHRFVSYIYLYENGEKLMNTGFAKVENRGVEMAEQAFKAYDNADSDYIKTFSTIKVNLVGDKINVVWTSSGQG